ncbi:MAG: CpaF family protein [Clostridiales bacterium]|nr:CpaF family protein [Clostridiales bacterium]
MIKELTADVREAIHSRGEDLSDRQVLDLIEDRVLKDSRIVSSDYKTKGRIIEGIFYATRRELDILQPYAEDDQISEIMVNGKDSIYIEKQGKVTKLDLAFDTTEDLEEMARRLAGKVHREINDLSPIVDARMSDGSRFHAVSRSVALNGPALNIRRFPKVQITMEDLIQKETISRQAADFLASAVRAGLNIFISGGTSSGKTTFLNVLASCIPKEERVIVIEDSAELQLGELENVVRMETRTANSREKGQVTMGQLIAASLRMRPDRIIVGEVRGGEVLDMIQAMNTGHDGSLSTGHGNSPEAMVSRLEAMYLTAADYPLTAVRQQIGQALDLIVHLGRMPDRSRKVLEIAELVGYDGDNLRMNRLFKFKFNEGLIPTGNRLLRREKAELRGVTLDGGV